MNKGTNGIDGPTENYAAVYAATGPIDVSAADFTYLNGGRGRYADARVRDRDGSGGTRRWGHARKIITLYETKRPLPLLTEISVAGSLAGRQRVRGFLLPPPPPVSP